MPVFRRSVWSIGAIVSLLVCGVVVLRAPGSASAVPVHPVRAVAAADVPVSPGSLESVPPSRILDSRTGKGTPGPIPAGKSIAVQVSGQGGVPATGISAVAVNLTVTAPTAGGYLTAWADGQPQPTVSALDFQPRQTVANMAIVPVGADGKIRLFNGSAGTTQILADVTGYFLLGTAIVPGSFTSVPPSRILDSRTGKGTPGPIPAGKSIAVQVSGQGGVPATGISAVAVNLTVTAPTAGGYLTAWADGQPQPTVSALDFQPRQTVANMAIVPVGADGKIRLFNGSAGTTQILADVTGYFLLGTAIVPGSFTSVPPSRILDSRTGKGTPGPIPAGKSIAVQVSGQGGVPATGISAVAVNLTVTAPTAGGYLTAWADGQPQPTVSALDFQPRQTVANMAIVPVGADGKIRLFNGSAGTTQILADVTGYFLVGAATGWSDPNLIDPDSGSLVDVSCVTSSFCMAVDEYDNAFRYDGAAWHNAPGLGSLAGLTGLSCPSVSFCMAVAFGGESSSFDGTHWSPLASMDIGSSFVNKVSCSSASFCVAVDNSGRYAVYRGSGWSTPAAVAPMQGSSIDSVSCAGPSFCAAVADFGTIATYDGTTWTQSNYVQLSANSQISCVSAQFCLVHDDNTGFSTFDGSVWAAPLSNSVNGPISCGSAHFCMEAGTDGTYKTYDGTAWSDASPVTLNANALDCPSATFCVAMSAIAAATYSDGAWSPTNMIDPEAGTPTAIACGAVRSCFATDANGNALHLTGTTWTPPTSIETLDTISSISCPDTAFCSTVTYSRLTYIGVHATYADGAWSSVSGSFSGTALSCASPTFCVSIGNNSLITTYDGTSWTGYVDPGKQYHPYTSLSCPTADFCAAVDSNGYATTLNSGVWSASVLIDPNPSPGALHISCAAQTFCIAVDDLGNAFTMTGTTWTPTQTIDKDGGGLTSISCPSTQFCIAVDADGYALQMTGGTWSADIPVQAELPGGLTGVSCPTAQFCAAIGPAGYASTFTPATP